MILIFSEDEYEEEEANVVLMVSIWASDDKTHSESKSESDSEEVFPDLSHSELELCLLEIMEKYQKLLNKYKDLKQIHVSETEVHNKFKKEFSTLSEEKFILITTPPLKARALNSEEEILSEASVNSDNVTKKYEKSFQIFLAKNIDRSKMNSMINGVSRNERREISYVPKEKPTLKPKAKPKTLYFHFSYAYKQHDYSSQKPKITKNSGRTNQKRPKKMWEPKNNIIYVASILSSSVKTPFMVPGL